MNSRKVARSLLPIFFFFFFAGRLSLNGSVKLWRKSIEKQLLSASIAVVSIGITFKAKRNKCTAVAKEFQFEIRIQTWYDAYVQEKVYMLWSRRPVIFYININTDMKSLF